MLNTGIGVMSHIMMLFYISVLLSGVALLIINYFVAKRSENRLYGDFFRLNTLFFIFVLASVVLFYKEEMMLFKNINSILSFIYDLTLVLFIYSLISFLLKVFEKKIINFGEWILRIYLMSYVIFWQLLYIFKKKVL